MKLEGKSINHIKYGEGIIKESKDNYITIQFSQGVKKFLYPNAFHKHLTFSDQIVQKRMHEELMISQKEINKNEVNKNEIDKKETDKSEKDTKYNTLNKNISRKSKNVKLNQSTSNSQAVFGFVQNSSEEVFSSWSVYAGTYQSGSSRGSHKKPVGVKWNTACLLTECPKGEAEKSRQIIGVFMPKETFEGSTCKDGIIHSHETYRIKLEERERLLFWNYITSNERLANWGNVELRYMSFVTMKKILNDIRQIIGDQKRRQDAELLYEYFCLVNSKGNS